MAAMAKTAAAMTKKLEALDLQASLARWSMRAGCGWDSSHAEGYPMFAINQGAGTGVTIDG